MSTTPPAQTALVLLLLAGCMSDASFFQNGEERDYDDTGGAPADSQADTGEWDQAVPEWWSLEASVLVEESLAVADDTTLLGSLVSVEAEPSSPICTASFAPASLSEQDPPDAVIFHWWEIELEQGESDCSNPLLAWFPDNIEIGVGELHPDIAALLEPAGYGSLEPYLYGAYLRQGGQTGAVWAWGIAGTSASFDGDAEPASEAPLPNGAYQLLPFYLLPLEGR